MYNLLKLINVATGGESYLTKVKEVNGAYKRMRLLVDEELLQLIDQGNSQALECLIQKYKGVVWGKAQTYFLIGGDREDIIQEGMIEIGRASLDYDEEKLDWYRGLADRCITDHI